MEAKEIEIAVGRESDVTERGSFLTHDASGVPVLVTFGAIAWRPFEVCAECTVTTETAARATAVRKLTMAGGLSWVEAVTSACAAIAHRPAALKSAIRRCGMMTISSAQN